jgi:hypothetical protein
MINGWTITYGTVGAIILWSGINNVPLSNALKDIVQGQSLPDNNASDAANNQTSATVTALANANSAKDVSANTITSIQNYGATVLVASTYGWGPPGNEFACLTEVINRESGGNALATNSESGAFGIAQALGHGLGAATQGTITNEYGGYGVPNSTCKSANSGDPTSQLVWMMAYIKETYGDPVGAWNSEQTRGYY